MIRKLKIYLVHFLYIIGLFASFLISFLFFQNRKKKEKIQNLKRKKLQLVCEKNIIIFEIKLERKQKEIKRKIKIKRQKKLLSEVNRKRNLKIKNIISKSRNMILASSDIAKNKNLKLNKYSGFVRIYK